MCKRTSPSFLFYIVCVNFVLNFSICSIFLFIDKCIVLQLILYFLTTAKEN